MHVATFVINAQIFTGLKTHKLHPNHTHPQDIIIPY
jgi:hypothetical protein